MDKRISELCNMLPACPYQDGLIAGFKDRSVIEGFGKWVNNLEISDLENSNKWKENGFELVLCYLPDTQQTTVIRNVFRALHKGGTGVFLIPSKISAGYLEKIISAQENDTNQGSRKTLRSYGLTPSLEDIRLIVPLRNKACIAASLALYQPSLKKAKIRKHLAYILGRAGLSSLWIPYRLIISQNAHTVSLQGIPTLAKKHFGDHVEVALFTGTPGYLRKTTIQIMDQTGSILGYCKVSNNTQTKAVLQNEADMLDLLSRLSLGNALTPAKLFAGESHAGDFCLIQSTKKSYMSSAPLIPDDMHLDFLTRLIGQTRREGAFLESPGYCEVAERLTSVCGYADTGKYQELSKALEWASQVLSRNKITLFLAHRDFTPWNTFISKGQLFVFDWEFARSGWIPLADAFHFILQKGILVDRCQPDVLWEKLFSVTSREGRFIRQCAALIGASDETILALLAFYLCDIITMYLYHYGQDGHTPPDGETLIGSWVGLLQILHNKRGAYLS
jgi:hypothetical protein